MSTPSQFAEREMRRLSAQAKAMLQEASAGIGPGHEIEAQKRLRRLFDDAPWLAKSDALTPGCGDLTYRDLFALHLLLERTST